MPSPGGPGEMLWAVGDYDLAPSEWSDPTSRALVLAELPTASYTPPEQLGEIYQAQGMGKLHLRARAWRRLDHEEQT